MTLEDQYRHLLALGKIGDLMQQAMEDRMSGPRGGGSSNRVHIVNRNGRHVLMK